MLGALLTVGEVVALLRKLHRYNDGDALITIKPTAAPRHMTVHLVTEGQWGRVFHVRSIQELEDQLINEAATEATNMLLKDVLR